jgi:hypothetical protein
VNLTGYFDESGTHGPDAKVNPDNFGGVVELADIVKKSKLDDCHQRWPVEGGF